MTSDLRRSRQLAMNSTSVTANSRNSVKVGDRNSKVDCTHSSFGIWTGAPGSVSDPPSMLCSCCQSASGRSNRCIFSFSSAASSGRRLLHSISGAEISATMNAAPAQASVTISTADTERGIRCRSRYPAAGDSMVPTMKAVVMGRKKALAK